MRARGAWDHAGDAAVEKPLYDAWRGVVDQDRNGRWGACAAERLKFGEPADIMPVDCDQIEALAA